MVSRRTEVDAAAFPSVRQRPESLPSAERSPCEGTEVLGVSTAGARRILGDGMSPRASGENETWRRDVAGAEALRGGCACAGVICGHPGREAVSK